MPTGQSILIKPFDFVRDVWSHLPGRIQSIWPKMWSDNWANCLLWRCGVILAKLSPKIVFFVFSSCLFSSNNRLSLNFLWIHFYTFSTAFLVPDCIPRLNVRIIHTEWSKREIMRKNEKQWAKMRKKKYSIEKDTATKPRELTSPKNEPKTQGIDFTK